MKSMALVAITNRGNITDALDHVLPGHREPWLLLTKEGDPIAYFHIKPEGSDCEVPYTRQ